MFIFTIFKGIRLLISTVMMLAILVVALPYLATVQPFRHNLLAMVLPPTDGEVTCGGASFGWVSAVRFSDVEIKAPDGSTVLRAAGVQGEKSLWRCFVADDLGTLEFDQAQISIVATEDGTNLARAFRYGEGGAPAPRAASKMKIPNATLSFQGVGAAEPWTIEGVNLELAVQPAAATESGQAELVVEPGTLLADAAITPAMCNDLLKYVIPVLAGNTRASGKLNVELDEWRIPLDEPAAARGGGHLVIHELDASGGPIITELARRARVPSSIRLPNDSRLSFSLAQGRIYHRDVQFTAGGVAVVSEGSVGINQTLDLEVEVPLSVDLSGDMLSPGRLADQTVRLPITGRFGQPVVSNPTPGVDAPTAGSIADRGEDVLLPPPTHPPLPEPTSTTILPPRPVPAPSPTIPTQPPATSPTEPPPATQPQIASPVVQPESATAGTLPPLRPQTTPPATMPERDVPADSAPRITERPRDHLLDHWRDRYR